MISRANETSESLGPRSGKTFPTAPRFGFKSVDIKAATRHFLEWRHLAVQKKLLLLNGILVLAVTVMLFLALAYRLADLARELTRLDGGETELPREFPGTPEPAVQAAGIVDYTALIDSHLFGQRAPDPATPAASATIDPAPAPETTLNLVLKGTIADLADERGGVAIIANGATQRPYFAADEIDGTGGVSLHSIHGDRVVLDRDGRLETLWLASAHESGRVGAAMPPPLARSAPGLAPSMARSAPAMPPASDSMAFPEPAEDNASRLDEFVRVVPHLEQGRVIGLRLQPGDRPESLAELGFESGDLVTGINGMAMTEAGGGARVFEHLDRGSMANVTVVRGGVAQVLTIDTSVIE